MKKLLTLTMVLMLAVVAVAHAEEAAGIPPVDLGTIDFPYEPSWIAFENGMQIAMPADWTAIDLTDEAAETGFFYLAQSPDRINRLGLAYLPIGVTDIDTLAAAFAMLYPDLGVITVNGVDMIAYDEPDGSHSALLTVDGLGGMYMLTFAPVVEDEATTMLAVSMMASLSPVTPEN